MVAKGFTVRKRTAVAVCALLAVASGCEVGSRQAPEGAVGDRTKSATPPADFASRESREPGLDRGATASAELAPRYEMPTTRASGMAVAPGMRLGTIGHAAPGDAAGLPRAPVPVEAAAPGSMGAMGAGSGSMASNGPMAKGVSAPPFGMIGALTAPMATGAPARWGQGGGLQIAAGAARRLDPNARYATTYRPGGAALAAFDAAVSRGQIPTSYKNLVGDFGARYAPALDAPKEGALAIAVGTERAAVGPGGGPLNLLVSLASSEATPPRAPLSVHIVLDVSGSMSGPAIEDAKQAAEAAVAKLEPRDDFSMVTFSSDAQVLVADGPIGPRRAQVLARIHAVEAGGGTNISSGLDLGYAEARVPGAGADAVRIVMLLSDGHANAGDTDPQSLAERAARAFQDGVQTSAFGLGPDYDAALMSGIADRGAGGYYYLADSSQIEPALAREIDARLRPVATAVEVRVRLRPDVSATRVYGSRELSALEADAVRAQEVAVDQHEQRHGIAADRQTDAAGGMRFFIPAFARADRHATMITLDLPPGTGQRRIASVEVRYKDRVLDKNVTTELPVDERWAATDAESAGTTNPSVERVEQAFAAGEAILQAADLVDHADRAGARTLLDERAAVLRSAAAVLGEGRFIEDAGRLERLADAVGGAQRIADALPLVVMLRGSGYGYL
jgi:Ca-activated chloride channel family protein